MQIPGFQITRKISQGGMSSVYLAIQQSIGREVALKVMSPTLAQDAHFSERFQREATIVGQLSHPNIISIYDIGKHHGLNYIAMDYLAKGSLSQKMRNGLSGLEAVKILKQLASALAHAHHCGYVHRDIKPENILFRADDNAVLSDFGVAKAIKQNLGVTHAGTVLGTPNYMSPEQAKGQPCDGRSDLYSLGVVFFEMLCGKLPYQAEEAVAIAIKHLTAPIPKLPPQHALFQPLIDELLAKNPDERIQSGEELIERIELLETGLKTPKISYKSLAASGEFKLGLFQRLQALVFVAWQKLTPLFISENSQQEKLQQASRYTTAINANQDSGVFEEHALTHSAPGKSHNLAILLSASLFILLGFFAYQNSFTEVSAETSSLNDAAELVIEQDANDKESLADKSSNIEQKPKAQLASAEQENMSERLAALNVDQEPTLILNGALENDSKMRQETAEPSLSKQRAATNLNQEGKATFALLNSEQKQSSTLSEQSSEVNTEAQAASYPLTIRSTPAADRIRILNIKPKYYAGIELVAGSYLVELSKANYKTLKRWVRVSDKGVSRRFTLSKQYQQGETFTDTLNEYSSAPEMVVVPSGSFSMGSKLDSNSLPIRQVIIDKSFAVSRYEISFADYQVYLDDKKVTQSAPNDQGWGKGNRPIINISWQEAVDYTQWLSEKTGRKYRLLSEAEWEYVARANHAGSYWWPQNSRRMANCRRGCNSDFAKLFGTQTSPLGYYPANPFGIYDTAGNVSEWVLDCHTDHYLGAKANAEPRLIPACTERTVRGGSHGDSIEKISSHSRQGVDMETRSNKIGFRILAEI
ncbi:bifunctional serine/threonine-protein kinase/formylglycine-generating enzyme family protein [uncultured Pseudoteredinibacter sp.]|uniref:bifunctional serine/threonine-protein kinase/formylglycine-generating enzyme family protein n=1 Tax=uncultured Pseudoteredinibacter sp. TaxID=1641701 RepID=UPI00262A5770|nr:bifunctional serine/threonine-protein kinase/formylglycine-generating enzyme family protein [uncultured Pseudoteredinibacter sp.]